MSLELAAQVGALVGTSALLFLATQPPADPLAQRAAIPEDLRGGLKRFSSYQRLRYYRRQQTMSSAASVSNGSLSDNNSVTSQQSSS